MSLTNTLPIVGAFYRPPAKVLISVLGIGTPLYLLAEPDNPADPNAIAVFLPSSEIPESAHALLETGLEQYGFSLQQVLDQELWHLGYVPKEAAAKLVQQNVIGSDRFLVAFDLSPSGSARIYSTVPFDI